MISWPTVINVLIFCCPFISSKGIILYGQGKVQANKKGQPNPTTNSDADEVPEKFQFALFTPTSKLGTPSEKFKNFTSQAISAKLIGHNRNRPYYFIMEKTVFDDAWMSDSNVCNAEAKAWQLHTNDGFRFADSEQRVTIYFLCDFYCCNTQCCDLNVIFLVCMIFFILVGLAITIWLCCRYGRRYCSRSKEPPEDEFVDAEEYLTTDAPTSYSLQRTQSMPLKSFNSDDIRL